MTDQSTTSSTDVIIVGAGPVGVELAAALKQAGIDYIHLEAGQLGQTLTWWPHSTHFFSSPERISIAGVPIQTIDQEHVTGEQYLAYLRMVAMTFDLRFHFYEPVTAIEKQAAGFEVRTQTHSGPRRYHCRSVALATGGLAEPNRLGIPGEELAHISHYFSDPHRYFQQRLLIVGGRNAALEAALRCWRAGAEVTVSYRGPEIDPKTVRGFVYEDFQARLREEAIRFFPSTAPVEITPESVLLAPTESGRHVEGERMQLGVDFVLLLTGYKADLRLYEMLGVRMEGAAQAPHFDPETMETNVPGVYVAGTAAGGSQQGNYKLFIETSHKDIPKIVESICSRLGLKPKS